MAATVRITAATQMRSRVKSHVLGLLALFNHGRCLLYLGWKSKNDEKQAVIVIWRKFASLPRSAGVDQSRSLGGAECAPDLMHGPIGLCLYDETTFWWVQALAVCEMFTYMPTHRQTHKPRYVTSGSMLHVMFNVKSVIRYWTVNIVKIGV